MPTKKKPAKKPARKTTPKKKAAKKVAPKKKRTVPGRKPMTTKKDNGHGGKRISSIDYFINEVAADVERYLHSMNTDNVYKDDLTLTELTFCQLYIENKYKVIPTVKQTFGDSGEDEQRLWERGKKLLEKTEVQEYLSYELRLRRVKTSITHEWVANKYRSWVEQDLTQFFRVVPAKRGKKTVYRVEPKVEFEDMPLEVRRCIKVLRVDTHGSLQVEFIDQKSALDSLSKLMGFEAKDLNVNLNGGVNLHFDKEDEGA